MPEVNIKPANVNWVLTLRVGSRYLSRLAASVLSYRLVAQKMRKNRNFHSCQKTRAWRRLPLRRLWNVSNCLVRSECLKIIKWSSVPEDSDLMYYITKNTYHFLRRKTQ